MKKVSILFLLTMLTSCSSCSDKSAMDSCIDDLISQGYDYDEAVSECEYAQMDSKIRR